MNHYELVRSYLKNATVGYLNYNGSTIDTLELPWKNNKPNESCIPEGVYLVKRDRAGRHQYYSIQNVVGRTFIEIHPAYKPSDLLGCIGFGIANIDNPAKLYKSEEVVNEFLQFQGDDDFILTIRGFNPHIDNF